MKLGTKFKHKATPVTGRKRTHLVINLNSNKIQTTTQRRKRRGRRRERSYNLLLAVIVIVILYSVTITTTTIVSCKETCHTAIESGASGCKIKAHNLPEKVSRLVDMMVSGPLNQSESSRLLVDLATGSGESELPVEERNYEQQDHETAALILDNYNKKHLRRSKQLRKLLSRPGSFLSSFVPHTNPTGERILQQPNSLVGRNLRRLHLKLHKTNANKFNQPILHQTPNQLVMSAAQPSAALANPAFNEQNRPKYLPFTSQVPQFQQPNHRVEQPKSFAIRGTLQPALNQQQSPVIGESFNQRPRQVVLVHRLPPPLQSSFSIETPIATSAAEDSIAEEEEEQTNESSPSSADPDDETEHNLAQVDNLIKHEFENRLNLNEQFRHQANNNDQSHDEQQQQKLASNISSTESVDQELTSSTTNSPDVLYLETTLPTTQQQQQFDDSWRDDATPVASSEAPEVDYSPNLLIATSADKGGGADGASLRTQFARDVPFATARIGSPGTGAGATVIAGETTSTRSVAPLLSARPFVSGGNNLEAVNLLKMSNVRDSHNQSQSMMSAFTIDNKSSLLRPTALTSFQRVTNPPQVAHLLPGGGGGGNNMNERQVNLRAPAAIALHPGARFASTPSAPEHQLKQKLTTSHPLHPVNQQQRQQQVNQQQQTNGSALSFVPMFDNSAEQQQWQQQFRNKINQNNNMLKQPPVASLSHHEFSDDRRLENLNGHQSIVVSGGSAELDETLNRLRETKAKIKQLQAEINATNPNLLLVNASSALLINNNNNGSSNRLGSAPDSSVERKSNSNGESILSAMMSLFPLSSNSMSSSSSNSSSEQQQTTDVTTGDLFRFWPLSYNGSGGSLFLKGGTVLRAQDSMNIPIGMYHNGPLTAPARLVASAFGRAAQSTLAAHFPVTPTQWSLPQLSKNPMGLQVPVTTPSSAPILLGSTLTVASEDLNPPTTPTPQDELRASGSTRRPYSWPLATVREPTTSTFTRSTSNAAGEQLILAGKTGSPGTSSPSQLRSGNGLAKLAQQQQQQATSQQPHTMIAEVLTGNGEQPVMSNMESSSGSTLNQWPTAIARHNRYQQVQLQKKSDDKTSTGFKNEQQQSAGKPISPNSATDHLRPVLSSTSRKPLLSPLADNSIGQTTHLPGRLRNQSTDITSTSTTTRAAAAQFPPKSINAILDKELFGSGGQPADKRDFGNVSNIATADQSDSKNSNSSSSNNLITRLFARFVNALSGQVVSTTSDHLPSAQNLTGEQELDGANSLDSKLTTERLLHALIYATCSAALLCLLAVLAILRCSATNSNDHRRKSAQGNHLVNQINNERAASGGGGGGLYQLDWRRFALGSAHSASANQRQVRDKLIHAGTMHNVSLLARHETSSKQTVANEANITSSATCSSTTPLRNTTKLCCHCNSCSSSGAKQRNQCHSHNQQSTCNQQPALCFAGLYQQGPRGKLPFGAASSVNKFLNHFNRKSGDAQQVKSGARQSASVEMANCAAEVGVARRGPIGGTRLRMMSAIDERISPSFAALPMSTGSRCSEELNEDVSLALRCTCNLYNDQQPLSSPQQQQIEPSSEGCCANYLIRHHNQQHHHFSPGAITAEAPTSCNNSTVSNQFELSKNYNESKSGGCCVETNAANCDHHFNGLDNENNNNNANVNNNNKRCNCDKSIKRDSYSNIAPCGLSDRVSSASAVVPEMSNHQQQQQQQHQEVEQVKVKCNSKNQKSSAAGSGGQFDSINEATTVEEQHQQQQEATSAKHVVVNCESVACGCCSLRANYTDECYAKEQQQQLMSDMNTSATESAAQLLPSTKSASAKQELLPSPAAKQLIGCCSNSSNLRQHSPQSSENKQQQVTHTGVCCLNRQRETASDGNNDDDDDDEEEDDDLDEEDEDEEDLNDSGCCPHDIREIDELPSSSSLDNEDTDAAAAATSAQDEQVRGGKTRSKNKSLKGEQQEQLRRSRKAAKSGFLTSPLSLAATFRRKLRRTLIDVNERHQQSQVKQPQLQQQQQHTQIDPLPVTLSPNRHQATQETNSQLHHHHHHQHPHPQENRPKPDVVVQIRASSQDAQKPLGCGQEQFKTCCDRFDNIKL